MGDRSLAFCVVSLVLWGEMPPLCKGRWQRVSADGGIVALRGRPIYGRGHNPPVTASPCQPPLHKGAFWPIASILLYQIPRPCATGFERLRGSLLAAAPSPGGRCFDSFQGIVKHTLKLPKHPPAMRIYLKHFSLSDRVRNEK